MFNLEDHVDLTQSSHIPMHCTTKIAEPCKRDSDTDILVKICFDQDEGISPSDGRYATFYNLYMIKKRWALQRSNCALLAKRFPAFVVLHWPRLNAIVQEGVYKPETKEWFNTNVEDYFILVPIITVRKGEFKLAGVHIPKSNTHRGLFQMNTSTLKMVSFQYYGTWVNFNYTPHGADPIFQVNSLTKYTEKTDLVRTWIQSEVEALGNALI